MNIAMTIDYHSTNNNFTPNDQIKKYFIKSYYYFILLLSLINVKVPIFIVIQ